MACWRGAPRVWAVGILVSLLFGAAGCRKPKQHTDIAFVLLSTAALPKAEEIVRSFSEFSPQGHRLQVVKSESKDPKVPEVLEFDVSPKGTAMVALMPFPVPKGEAEAAAQYSVSAIGTDWRPSPHAAHLLISLRDAGVELASERLSRFTSLVAAVTKAADASASAVYWGAAGATHSAEFVVSTARQLGSERLMLWTGVSRASEKDGRTSLLSLGMNQLDLPDLLFVTAQSDGTEAFGTFFDLLTYVVKRGKAIPENDTVGRTADERWKVRYVPSPIDSTKRVWRVDAN